MILLKVFRNTLRSILLVSVNLKLLMMGVRKTIEFIKDMNKKKSMVENIVITLKLYFNNAEVEVCG